MTSASLHEIKKELSTLDADVLASVCLRLAKYKKENKELLAYLLFDAGDEQTYVSEVKEAVNGLFTEVTPRNSYFVKKTLRKILRYVNRQIKYSGIKQTELELSIHFCSNMKQAKIPLPMGTILFNLYHQQVKKIYEILEKLPEDLQADYQREIETLV